MAESPQEVTQLLQAWSRGEQGALDKLAPVVYRELHRLAQRYMAQERPGQTLQATALVNEAYLRLVDVKQVSWQTALTSSALRRNSCGASWWSGRARGAR